MNHRYLSPCINFQGKAREAMEFYHKVFGGKLDLQTVSRQGVPKAAASRCGSQGRPGAWGWAG